MYFWEFTRLLILHIDLLPLNAMVAHVITVPKFRPMEWKSIVFSGEKKFNFDGPDGSKCYWHDLLSARNPLTLHFFA